MKTHKLTPADDVSGFGCGVTELDDYLKKYALLNNRIDDAVTYVAHNAGGTLVGFYTLVVGSVIHACAPQRVSKGLPQHPIPVMILARLAVDTAFRGQGLGYDLILDALCRIMKAADIAGIRAVLVHAKNEHLAQWYERLGFERGPDDRSLFLLMKDVRRAAKEVGVSQ